VTNLKGAIGNMDDKDINIKVDKGVVYIDISDKLLFKSASFDVTDRAKEVLGKVAMVLKNQPDIEFMVEGHTDNVAYKGKNGILLDNWDLSVKRATPLFASYKTSMASTRLKWLPPDAQNLNPLPIIPPLKARLPIAGPGSLSCHSLTSSSNCLRLNHNPGFFAKPELSNELNCQVKCHHELPPVKTGGNS
jgi:hypothetical protein